MKAVAIFKWAANPDDALVRADGSVNWNAARHDIGDDDHAAVACAVKVAADNEVIGLTLAGGDTAFAAARGAERTVAIEGLPVPADSTVVAHALADAIQEIGDVSVVTIGDADWDPSVSTLLAGLLGWPAITLVDVAEPGNNGIIVTRRFGTGTQDLSVDYPVVLDVAARREEENKPGMKQVLTARKKPIDIVRAKDVQSTYISLGTRLPEAATSCLFDGSDPTHAVGQLLKALKAEGAL